MKAYLRMLSVFYFVGFCLHLADVLDLRLKFSEMDMLWRMWIMFLLIADLVASLLLWLFPSQGVFVFLLIAIFQLIAYVGFQDFFGPQWPLVLFHLACMVGLIVLKRRKKRT